MHMRLQGTGAFNHHSKNAGSAVCRPVCRHLHRPLPESLRPHALGHVDLSLGVLGLTAATPSAITGEVCRPNREPSLLDKVSVHNCISVRSLICHNQDNSEPNVLAGSTDDRRC